MWWQLIAMPALGGLIGWFTNHLAIRMLFRPRRPRRVLGVTVQGLVPRRRGELAERVAQTIEREFISHEDIKAILQDPSYQDALGARLAEGLREYLAGKVTNGPRLLKAVVTEALLDRLAAAAAQGVMRRLPGLIEGALGEFERRFDIQEVVRSKIEAFELDRLEATVLELARTELRFIEVLGGVIGALVGLLFGALELLVR